MRDIISFRTVLLAISIGLTSYYVWPQEPAWAPAVLCLCAAGLLLTGVVVARGTIAIVLVLVAWVLVGHAYAQFRSLSALRTVDIRPGETRELSGQLVWIERSGSGRARLLIRPDPDGLCGDRACMVRVLASAGRLEPGDHIRLRAVLNPPSRPIVPGAYAFDFHAYHRALVATGFAVSTAEMVEGVGVTSPDVWLARLRWRLSRHIQSRFTNSQGGLGTALLTGDRSSLSTDDAAALRASGLGHILAISGLHMGLFAGGSFFAFRFLLAVMFARHGRWDPAPAAAGFALLAGTLYLLLSGGSIPTQRAYVMAVVSLGAVCLGRRAISMHTLLLAMGIVLLIRPHSLMGVGFQMSFAAVGALIAVYEVWRARRPARAPIDNRNGIWSGLARGLGGLSLTSLVAGSATAGFAAMHFHRIASFGMLANLLAMPVFTFVVMPAGAIGLLLAPLSLDALPFWLMQTGLDLVVKIGHWVSGLPGARQNIAAPPAAVIGLYITGFAGAVLMTGRMRYLGVGVGVLALSLWSVAPLPSLYVSETGVVVGRFEVPASGPALEPTPGTAEWQVTTRRRDRFDVRVFLERVGLTDTVRRGDLACDAAGCGADVEGLQLVVLSDLSQLDSDCGRADLIISDVPVPEWRRQSCAAMILDPERLREFGAHQFWIREGAIRRYQTVTAPKRRRVWMR